MRTEGEKEMCHLLIISIPLSSVKLMDIIQTSRLTLIYTSMLFIFFISTKYCFTHPHVYYSALLINICVCICISSVCVLKVFIHSQSRRAGTGGQLCPSHCWTLSYYDENTFSQIALFRIPRRENSWTHYFFTAALCHFFFF